MNFNRVRYTTELLCSIRQMQVSQRLQENAEARDTDAVLGMRVETTGIYNGSAGTQAFTVQAYGTAVITELRT